MAPARGLRATACAAVTAAAFAVAMPAHAQDAGCPLGRDLLFINGEIHTMDDSNSVVGRVRIANGRFSAVGNTAVAGGSCTDVIDLRGRTVIPGMIENHTHILLAGIRPGHETRTIETAFSIAQVQDVIRERAGTVPAGEFVTAIGGFEPRQFTEGRLPTLAELDEAAPAHPVYIHARFNGPATTNSLGKVFLERRGVPVADDGSIAANAPSVAAFNALDSIWSFDDRKQTTLDVIDYFTSVGITTAHAVGGSAAQGPGHFEPGVDRAVILELLEEGRVDMRLRMYLNASDDRAGNPGARAILDNQFPNFGGDLVRTAGIGEHLVTFPLEGQVPLGQIYIDGTLLLAERGWQLMEHSFNDRNHVARADVWEVVNERFPIADLRWTVDHVNTIEETTLGRLKALGVAIRAHGWRYLNGSPENNGPPYRTILDSGIQVGAGFDGAQAAPINPWLHVYYMVTGIDSTGTLINDGQQITRDEAVRLYTAANSWFSFEEDVLGSIEVGKFGDLVVLSRDVFDETAVSDEELKRIRSVLTTVGGKIVHGDPDAL